MDIKGIFKELYHESVDILVYPKKTWEALKNGQQVSEKSVKSYFLLSVIIIFFSVALGTMLFQSDGGILWIEVFTEAFRKTIMMIFFYYSSLFWIYEMLRLFRLKPQFKDARKLAIYSMTPVLIMTGITGLLPFLGMIGILGFYGFVLLYLGIQEFFKIEKETAISFFIVLLLVLLVNAWFVLFIITKLVDLFVY